MAGEGFFKEIKLKRKKKFRFFSIGDEGIIKIYDQKEGDLKQVLSNNHLTGGSINKLLITNDNLVASFNDR